VKAQVHVRLKEGVLDPQGAAIGRALAQLGFAGLGPVRQGKLIELELDQRDPAKAAAEVRSMCDQLLANPVIETYSVTFED
jgi:phosphoribosylformylglycinamidine synthase subunit PurS